MENEEKSASATLSNKTNGHVKLTNGTQIGSTKVPYLSSLTGLVILATFTGCLGNFCAGAILGWPSPALPDINHNPNPFFLSDDQSSWVGSIGSLGSLVGAICTGLLIDSVGRKLGLLITSVPLTIGWAITAAAPNVATLYAGRFVTGLCRTLLTYTVHVYIAEIAPPVTRGLLLASASVFFSLGQLFEYSVGYVLHWNWLAIASSAIAVVMVFFLVFMPETPFYLIGKGKPEGAAIVLRALRHSNRVEKELLAIEDSIKGSKDKITLREVFHVHFIKPMSISLGLFTFQQFSGNMIIKTYTVSIFQAAGSSLDPNVETIIMGIIGLAGTMVSSLLIDHLGRRKLLVISSIGMAVCLAAAGAYFKVYASNKTYATDNLFWLPLVSLVLFAFTFSLAYDPIPYMTPSELFPTKTRGLANSIAGAWEAICSFIVSKYFVELTNVIYIYGVFWLCSGICLCAVVFIVVCFPETSRLSLAKFRV